MFGLAIIAASLNLMVLKFMMLNTEDEKRDEQEAIQAAAHTVRVDGDVILQENDAVHWQAEGMDMEDEVRSVCSCNGCYPLHRLVYSQQPREQPELWASIPPPLRRQCSVSAIEETLRRPKVVKKPSCDHGLLAAAATLPSTSVADLRRSTVVSMLRLPSASPLLLHGEDARIILQCPSCDARIVQQFLSNHEEVGSRTSFDLSLGEHDRISRGSELNIFSRLWRTLSSGGNLGGDTFSQPSPIDNRHSSFLIDEMESLKVLPKEQNSQYYKRVSL
eukprot:TRINITY_DN9154_c0_g1_i1.p1 TRINITY_DN9154_c0_g1~~TRINITY_DN9154_c0_g1_i1.p1  ORF type:complete len:276 (+),score=92.90 TRINITY_DN9154_c0_g1_i1:222-1049(+)